MSKSSSRLNKKGSILVSVYGTCSLPTKTFRRETVYKTRVVFLHFFPSRLGPQAEVRSASTKGHVAYHGTAVGNVRNILDCGDLMLPGICTP